MSVTYKFPHDSPIRYLHRIKAAGCRTRKSASPRCGNRCFRIGQSKQMIRTHHRLEIGSDHIGLVREKGVEPSLRWNWCLKPARLPFRHSRRYCFIRQSRNNSNSVPTPGAKVNRCRAKKCQRGARRQRFLRRMLPGPCAAAQEPL